MKIAHVVGARPNFMKIAPTMAALAGKEGVEQYLVHTGQHYDEVLSDVFFEDLDLPEPDYSLGIGSGNHAEQTARIMLSLEPVLTREAPIRSSSRATRIRQWPLLSRPPSSTFLSSTSRRAFEVETGRCLKRSIASSPTTSR